MGLVNTLTIGVHMQLLCFGQKTLFPCIMHCLWLLDFVPPLAFVRVLRKMIKYILNSLFFTPIIQLSLL